MQPGPATNANLLLRAIVAGLALAPLFLLSSCGAGGEERSLTGGPGSGDPGSGDPGSGDPGSGDPGSGGGPGASGEPGVPLGWTPEFKVTNDATANSPAVSSMVTGTKCAAARPWAWAHST